MERSLYALDKNRLSSGSKLKGENVNIFPLFRLGIQVSLIVFLRASKLVQFVILSVHGAKKGLESALEDYVVHLMKKVCRDSEIKFRPKSISLRDVLT